MRKIVKLITLLSLLAGPSVLIAMHIGRSGEAFVEEGIKWQKVVYDDEDLGFTVLMPGDPVSGISSMGYIYTYSQYQQADYEVHTKFSKKRYTPPNTEQEFLQQIEEVFLDKAAISVLTVQDPAVQYAAELFFKDEKKIVRIYASKNALYWALVKGDFFLADAFFDSLKITK